MQTIGGVFDTLCNGPFEAKMYVDKSMTLDISCSPCLASLPMIQLWLGLSICTCALLRLLWWGEWWVNELWVFFNSIPGTCLSTQKTKNTEQVFNVHVWNILQCFISDFSNKKSTVVLMKAVHTGILVILLLMNPLQINCSASMNDDTEKKNSHVMGWDGLNKKSNVKMSKECSKLPVMCNICQLSKIQTTALWMRLIKIKIAM